MTVTLSPTHSGVEDWPSQKSVVPGLTRSGVIVIVELSGATTGRKESECGQMGVIATALTPRVTIGPPAARLYAVEPDGVEMMMPSPEQCTEPVPAAPSRTVTTRWIRW